MKETLSTYAVAERLLADEYANWTRNGAHALAEYLEELEGDMGEEMDLDLVALRCDFVEYETLIDWATDYFSQWRSDLNIDEDLEEGDEAIDEAIRDHINENGILIEFDGGIIVSNF